MGSLCTVGRGYMRSRQIEDTHESVIRPCVRCVRTYNHFHAPYPVSFCLSFNKSNLNAPDIVTIEL